MSSLREMATGDVNKKQEDRIRGTAKVDFNKPLDLTVLQGKVAVITGGASGIGLAIATSLAENGAHVALLDLSETGGKKSEDDLSAKGYTAKFFQADVTSWDSQLAAFKQILAWSGDKLDIAVLSAGLRSNNMRDMVLAGTDKDPKAEPVKPVSATLEVNLMGAYYSTHLALSYFNRLSDGTGFKPQLVFMASLAGYTEQALSTDYCASKHGLRGIWKSVRSHGSSFGGCQSNLLAPTWINTQQGTSRESLLSSSGVRMGELGDVVEGALRAICDDAVDARAICCVQGEAGKYGSNNFDFCDDILDFNAGKVLVEKLRAGAFGKIGSSG